MLFSVEVVIEGRIGVGKIKSLQPKRHKKLF